MQITVSVTPDVKLVLRLYREMLELREFELKVQELYRAAKLPGFVHLYVGEEAVAAGVSAHLTREDLVFSTHRGHGHALAKGVTGREVMAELWGKATGCSGGRGGSMHMYAPEYGFMGTNGVVGGGLPLATGAGLSAQLRKSGQVTICYFGDGAVNSGSFHESVNFGAVWNLPVVYVCENNLYATETAFWRATKNVSVASRGAAYDMPAMTVDGWPSMKPLTRPSHGRALEGDLRCWSARPTALLDTMRAIRARTTALVKKWRAGRKNVR